MSNYLATRKILRDEKPELPTPSALETASICHECPIALVSNAGPNYEMSSKRQTVLNSTHPCLGKERGADSSSTSHPSRNAVYSIKDVDLHHSVSPISNCNELTLRATDSINILHKVGPPSMMYRSTEDITDVTLQGVITSAAYQMIHHRST
eukprot:scaffold2588_cov99-Skeletonema_dohrnii-CCMP3373.AAC.1